MITAICGSWKPRSASSRAVPFSSLQVATYAIADDLAPPERSTPLARRTPAPGSDPLRALDPAHYVSVLTGQTVGRSRKISCPFHEDRTPSLHVYEHPEKGWYCFGCQRHGHTVYDLASLLCDLDTRGPSFIEPRGRLYALFLPWQNPPPTKRSAPRNAGRSGGATG